MPKPGPYAAVTDPEIIRVIVAARAPALGTRDIAEQFGISRQAMEKHLKRLVEEGKMNNAKVGSANAWWPTDEGRALLKTQSDGQ